MNEFEKTQDIEVSLLDLWERLRDGWRYVLGGAVLGLAGAGVTLMVLPPKYEAVAIVRVAQVGQISQNKVVGQPVEPPAQTVERMKTAAFQRRVAEFLGDQHWLSDIVQSGATKDIVLQLIKSTVGIEQVALIEMRVIGASPDVAQRRAEASISQLIKIHDELAKLPLAQMSSDLAIAREKLSSGERDLGVLDKMLSAPIAKDDRFAQHALIFSLKVQKETDVFKERQMIMTLESALAPPATLPTRAIEELSITDRPVSPKKGLLLALGLFGGLLAGVVAVFFVDAWRRAKRERAAKV